MRYIHIPILLLIVFTQTGCFDVHSGERRSDFHETGYIMDGDIIFHKSKSRQSRLISQVTGSPYTHMGILFRTGGKLQVYEAVGPVKSTPFEEFVKRGEDGDYEIKRLKDHRRYLTLENLEKLREAGLSYKGKPYDLKFQMNDDAIYCSELVFKMYGKALGLTIGKVQKFADFNLSDPEVVKELKRRYGGDFNMRELVITPKSMYESELLENVGPRWEIIRIIHLSAKAF